MSKLSHSHQLTTDVLDIIGAIQRGNDDLIPAVPHTAGPWSLAYSESNGDQLISIDAEKRHITLHRLEAPEDLGNARLIVAAPDAHRLASYIVENAREEELSEGVEVTFPAHVAVVILNAAQAFLTKATEGK
jgi:hypothetical protein